MSQWEDFNVQLNRNGRSASPFGEDPLELKHRVVASVGPLVGGSESETRSVHPPDPPRARWLVSIVEVSAPTGRTQ